MKILDRYILKSFLLTFFSVFIILFFIFILQGVWLFIGDLAGKGLDLAIIVKFLMFYAPIVVPLVLPLSVLLASIMTFGSFAENYEFAAMKSSGISLQRAMKWLTVCIFGLSIIAFFFSNNVIPYAQYEFTKLRKNIIKQKPAMAISEGQFNTIGESGINIKVDKKKGENGKELEGVLIHKKSLKTNNIVSVIVSKSGILKSNDEENLLYLELFDGNYYESVIPENYNDRDRQPFVKSSFKRYVISIDLSKMNTNEADGETISGNNMMNISELNITIDSLERAYKADIVSFADNMSNRVPLTNDFYYTSTDKEKQATQKFETNLLNLFTIQDQKKVLEMAKNNLAGIEFSVYSGKEDLGFKQKNIYRHYNAIHEKFMLAFSCILMFFIGAPLGAIIRKGGLGLPMVFAVVIFIIFHFVNTFGRKLAQETSVTPFIGIWMSTLILLPFAVILTHRATNDIGISFDFDWFTNLFKPLKSKLKDINDTFKTVNLNAFEVNTADEEYSKLVGQSNDDLIHLIKNFQALQVTPAYRAKALKVLETREIFQSDLEQQSNLYNKTYQLFQFHIADFKLLSIVAWLFFIGSLFLFKLHLIAQVIAMLLFYFFYFKVITNVIEAQKCTTRKLSSGLLYFSLLLSLPFYPLFYFYFKNFFEKEIQHINTQITSYESIE